MLNIPTPFGQVYAQPEEPDDAGAVRYQLTGPVRGMLYVSATHRPSQWDDFGAVRVALGSSAALWQDEPTGPLPVVRGRAYAGTLVRLLDVPTDQVKEQWGGLSYQDGQEYRDAPPQAAATLRTVMRACGEDFESRADLTRLRKQARQAAAPRLRGWLKRAIAAGEREAAAHKAQAEEYRREASACTALWWILARRYVDSPCLPLVALLADVPGSLAHRIRYLPKWAAIQHDAGTREEGRTKRFRAELAGLARASSVGDRAEAVRGASQQHHPVAI